MVDRAFLTEKRRAVLSGEFDGSDSSRRTHQSRIRTGSQAAIDELIEVAESPTIDNRDVFDPEKVGRLIGLLLGPDHRDLNLLGTPIPDTEYRHYADRLYVEIDKQIRYYQIDGSGE